MRSAWVQFHAAWRWDPIPRQRDLFGTVLRFGFVTIGFAPDLLTSEDDRAKARKAEEAELLALRTLRDHVAAQANAALADLNRAGLP